MKKKLNSLSVLLFVMIVFGCSKEDPTQETELIPDVVVDPPTDAPVVSSNVFDLSKWYLSIPDDNGKGKSTSIYESELNAGYQNSKYFFKGSDGGMVFKCPVNGFKTSTGTSYVRVELREMLRNGNTNISNKDLENNWVFGTAPKADIEKAAAYDGEMTATLAINKVTTTGDRSHVGRLVIGQIHANTDEPIRLYYRKLVDNELGSIYFGHEENLGDDTYYEMIGSRSSSADNPVDGIAIDEVFTYKIKTVGNEMWVTIQREGKEDVVQYVDMSPSGYDVGGQYMYFKAGIYHLNNTGDDDDYAQVTFYDLETSHTEK